MNDFRMYIGGARRLNQEQNLTFRKISQSRDYLGYHQHCHQIWKTFRHPVRELIISTSLKIFGCKVDKSSKLKWSYLRYIHCTPTTDCPDLFLVPPTKINYSVSKKTSARSLFTQENTDTERKEFGNSLPSSLYLDLLKFGSLLIQIKFRTGKL